jgi:hypothetical protein
MSFEINIFPPPIFGRSAVPKPYEGALRNMELCCVPSIDRRLGEPVTLAMVREYVTTLYSPAWLVLDTARAYK